MAKAVNVARMTFRISFGHWEDGDKVNPNTGEAIKVFSADFTHWAGQWSLTVTQQITMAGAGITDAIVFFIRHDDRVKRAMLIERGNHLYQIDSVAADDGSQLNGYDLVTCREVVAKHG